MKNYIKYLSTVLMIIGTCTSMWATVPTTAELNFGTPGVSADFEETSVTSITNSTSTPATSTSLSGYGPFSAYYIGKNDNGNQSIAIVDGSKDNEDPMTSKYLSMTTTSNGTCVSFARTVPAAFATKGAFSFKIAKTSKLTIGLYNGTASGTFAHANAAACLNFDGGSNIKISAGTNAAVTPTKWDQVVSSSLPSDDVLTITVIYNTEETSAEYGDGIALAAKSAHVYINGTAADDGIGNAKDFSIGGNDITTFWAFNNSGSKSTTNVARIDDIMIYDALPTQAGNTITLDKNNNDASGSSSGSARILADATSMINISAPTRTGYEVEGYYTTSACTTKVATDAGALQASITVSENTWTNSDSEWKRGADETFYTKWTANTYTVTFDKQSGSGGSDNVTATYDAAMPSATMPTRSGYNFEGYFTGTDGAGTKYYNADGSSANNWNETANTTLYAHWSAKSYTDYRFSCAELALTGPSEDTVFITSAASKSVRSQQAFHLTGSGLTPSTAFTFSFGNSDLNSRFAFKLANGSNVATDGSGAIDADIYVIYTPTSGDTDDDLNIATNLTVTMTGTKPKTATLNTKTIICRHLPTNFVIAAKRKGKWLALPSNMSGTSTPSPVEIAVDDADNPSVAYTATTNMYSLYDQAAGEYIKLAMKGQSDAPLFGSISTSPIGKSGDAIITNTLGNGYLWKLVQSRATGLTNAKEAKYTVYSKNNSTNHLRLKENSGNPIWGLYDSGIEELRLIPAQAATVVEAYFVEWGANGGVIEVDAEGISATKVQAVFDGKTSSKIALSETKTSGGKDSKYNYTVTFDNSISFSAADAVGKNLLLRWYTSGDVLAGVTSIQVPKIITTNTTMSSINSTKGYWKDLEVHVISGTLEANTASFSDAMTIDHLEIYPGATLKVTAGKNKGTFTANTLVLRNGWKRFGGKNYDVARVYIDVTTGKEASMVVAIHAYSDWYIDYDQYYPIAVPWDVTVADSISYRYCSVTPSVGVGDGKNIRLRYYDGAGRAAGTNAGSSNWKDYGKSGNLDVPAKLVPAQGYVMSAKRPTGKAFSIIRMAMTIPSATWTAEGEQGEVSGTHKNQVSVTAHGVGGSAPWYAQGWNYIANPYMACYNGNDDDITGKLLAQNGGSVKYATIPDTDFKGFNQVNIAEANLKPSSGFLVQVGTTGTLEFSKGKIIAPSAPARYTNEPEAISEQEAYIQLSNDVGAKDQMGLIIGWDYTADYEINADLSKMIGEANIVKTWMQYGGIDMAYVAINEQLAREWIPVTAHIPAEGEYTYSLMNSSTVDELEGLYLVDHETGAVTNLLYNDYTFSAEAGTNTERFAINAIVGNHKVPTGADITGVDKNGTEPVKFIWHDKVFILHNNVIYDSTGKRVNVINK